MASLKDRVTQRLAELRREHRRLDHAIATQEHYGETRASQQAGAVTYFGFLSVFPVLALAFFSVGYLSSVVPEIEDTLNTAISEMFPGLIGTGEGQLDLADIQDSAGAVGLAGLAGVLFAGLGWLSALRSALNTVFELPDAERPNFVVGKGRDLVTLVVLGTVLLIAVAVTGLVSGFSRDVLDLVGLDTSMEWLVQLVAIAFGLAANSVLFLAMFKLLADPDLPWRALASGAVFGAVGFEILKVLSRFLITQTQGNPAFQVFGLALIMLVWINYFSRVILYAAAWAFTSPAVAEAEAAKEPAPDFEVPGVPVTGAAFADRVEDGPPATSNGNADSRAGALAKGMAAGAVGAAGAAAAAAVVRRGRDR